MSGFASTKDLADKQLSSEELGPGLYGYTAEGDPNSSCRWTTARTGGVCGSCSTTTHREP